MVDSSIGGKTGIDTNEAKNLIGAFYHPEAVIADLNCLITLPKKHLINGLIEALKMFLTHDATSFAWLDNNLKHILKRKVEALENLIKTAVKIKKAVVENDYKENHERACLNFGHTIGHALEVIAKYKLLHGYAVALGILMEAQIAVKLQLLPIAKFKTIESFLARLGIYPKELKKFNLKDLLAAVKFDKKSRQGKVYYILLEDIGRVYQKEGKFAYHVADSFVEQAYLELIKE